MSRLRRTSQSQQQTIQLQQQQITNLQLQQQQQEHGNGTSENQYNQYANSNNDEELAQWEPPPDSDDESQQEEQQQEQQAASVNSRPRKKRRKQKATPSPTSNDSSTGEKVSRGNWDERIKQLRAFQKEKGHCRVPHGYKINHSLGYWVSNMRKSYRAKQEGQPSSLTDNQVHELNSIGFEWEVYGRLTDWEQRLKDLKAFKEQHGHCRVPGKYPANTSLGYWASDMRKEFKAYQESKPSRLNPQRVRDLEELGFGFSLGQPGKPWEVRFEQLHELYKANNNRHVLKPSDSALVQWIGRQRLEYRRFIQDEQSTMTAERVEKLNSIQFEWDGKYVVWREQYQRLKEFKTKYRHCRVAAIHEEEFPGLRWWVRKQRGLRRKKTSKDIDSSTDAELQRFTEDKVKLLDELGFDWKVIQDTRRDKKSGKFLPDTGRAARTRDDSRASSARIGASDASAACRTAGAGTDRTSSLSSTITGSSQEKQAALQPES